MAPLESVKSTGPASANTAVDDKLSASRLLGALQLVDRQHIRPYLLGCQLKRNQVLFEPGEDVRTTYFPCRGTMGSLLVVSSDGREVEAATIGYEGAIGGIVSAGHKPAYARALVQIGGPAFAIDTAKLEEAKLRSPMLRDLLYRYADALLAQMMQSVACNALHSAEARCSRWLLATHDRVDRSPIPLTQEALAEMLGIQRTTVTAVAKALQERGLIRYVRGQVEIVNRPALERAACECYESVEKHFARLLPAVAAANPSA